MLKATARILVEEVRVGDTVARLGGDEFVVILEPALNLSEVARIAKRIMAALQKPIEVNGDTAEIGVSIGVAFFPEHGEFSDPASGGRRRRDVRRQGCGKELLLRL